MMQSESNNSTGLNDLEGCLREVVEQVQASDIPRDRLNACLDRVIECLPGEVQSIDRRAVSGEPTAVASRAKYRRRWIFGSVTAAVILLILLHFESTSISFAGVAEAVSRKTWIHMTLHVGGDGASSESRKLGTRQFMAYRQRKKKGWFKFNDHKLKIYHSYDATEGVLYRVPEFDTRRETQLLEMTEALPLLLANGSAPDDPLSKLQFLGRRRDDLTVVKQETERVMDAGRQWLDYTVTLRIREQEQPIRILFRVDPNSKLPHRVRVIAEHNGQTFSTEAAFDYPDTGPADIHTMGVPRDAKLVDRVPNDDLARLITGIAAGRARFDDFRAVVVSIRGETGIWWRDHTPEMIHRKGNCIRRDLGFVRSEPVEPAHDVDPSVWWSQRPKEADYRLANIGIAGVEQSFDRRKITEPDGSERYEIVPGRAIDSRLDAEQWIPSFYTLTPDYAGRPPLGVPSERLEAIFETDSHDGPEGTVLLRVLPSGLRGSSTNPDADKRRAMPGGWKFWIDPAREYLVMRWDMQGSSYVVEAVAQSPKGHWYPTRVRRKSSDPSIKDTFTDFYVEFDVEIPDALFDVKPPLPVEELLRKSP